MLAIVGARGRTEDVYLFGSKNHLQLEHHIISRSNVRHPLLLLPLLILLLGIFRLQLEPIMFLNLPLNDLFCRTTCFSQCDDLSG